MNLYFQSIEFKITIDLAINVILYASDVTQLKWVLSKLFYLQATDMVLYLGYDGTNYLTGKLDDVSAFVFLHKKLYVMRMFCCKACQLQAIHGVNFLQKDAPNSIIEGDWQNRYQCL